jgi:hypothetical protein
MIIDKIIVSKESCFSENKYDIVYSNKEYIEKLFAQGVTPDNISESELKSYYVHIYFIETTEGGFFQLDKKIEKKNIILHYICDGLKAIKATRNINLFNQYLIEKKKQDTQNYIIFDKLFNYINRQEDILKLNANWLEENTKLSITENKYITHSHINSLENFKENQKKVNIKILKKLCKIANEEYLRITSYDQNNLYMNSCHFKTLHSYFYMIKEKNRYVMYNSFTKKEVSSVLIKGEKTEKKKFFSVFWCKMGG